MDKIEMQTMNFVKFVLAIGIVLPHGRPRITTMIVGGRNEMK